jgi:hypothetical protein
VYGVGISLHDYRLCIVRLSIFHIFISCEMSLFEKFDKVEFRFNGNQCFN